MLISNSLIGRKNERKRFEECLNSQRSEFVIVYGRRRVGKTFLIREFFKNKFTFSFVGAHNQPKEVQLENFAFKLKEYSKSSFLPKIQDWNEAFRELQNYLSTLKTKGKKVIFFDELPWADTQKSGFVVALENFWNSWAAFRNDILFIACGSATSWIVEKILNNQGGLHCRTTQEIYLRPFTLGEVKEFLAVNQVRWDNYQIAQAYMVFGGVPFYYTLLDKTQNLAQNIDRLFFESKNAVLRVEFSELFSSLFNKPDKYLSVIEIFAEKKEGFTREEISKKTGITGAGLTKMLDNLERCDFILGYSKFGGGKNNVVYRLCDFYTLFYYNFVAFNKSQEKNFWQKMILSPKISSWQGFSFELLCILHLEQMKNALGISGIHTNSSVWRAKDNSAQIDLVIKRADRIVNLCEMKFSRGKYEISPSDAQKLMERASIFIAETKTKYAVSNVLVTTYGVLDGKNYSVVDNEIVLDDLFL